MINISGRGGGVMVGGGGVARKKSAELRPVVKTKTGCRCLGRLTMAV